MSRRTVREWRAAVYATNAPEMTAAVKVLCLYLADNMSQLDRKVSVPREAIAKALGCHEQRVAERYKKAVDAGYLVRVLAGHVGRTAVYQGTWPDVECVRQSGTHSVRSEAGERTDSPDTLEHRRSVRFRDHAERENGGERTAPQDANKRADLFGGPTDRNVGSKEQAAAHVVRFPATGCRWHEHLCPEDCADHPGNREASA